MTSIRINPKTYFLHIQHTKQCFLFSSLYSSTPTSFVVPNPMLRLVYKLRFPVQTVQTSLVIKALTGAPPTARYYVHNTPLNGVKTRLSIVATFQHSVRPEHTIASTTAICTVATLARQFLFAAHITTPKNATRVLLDATITAPFIVPTVPKECILI